MSKRPRGITPLNEGNFLGGSETQITKTSSLQGRESFVPLLRDLTPQRMRDPVSDTVKETFVLPQWQHDNPPNIEPLDLVFHIRPHIWNEKSGGRMLAFNPYTLQVFLEEQYERALKLAAGVTEWPNNDTQKQTQMDTGRAVIKAKLKAVRNGEVAMDTGRSSKGLEITQEEKVYYFTDPDLVREIIQFSGVNIDPKTLKEQLEQPEKRVKPNEDWLSGPYESYRKITVLRRGDIANVCIPVDGKVYSGDAITCFLEGGVSDSTPGPVRLHFVSTPEPRRVPVKEDPVTKKQSWTYSLKPAFVIGYANFVGNLPETSTNTLVKNMDRTDTTYRIKTAKISIKVVIEL